MPIGPVWAVTRAKGHGHRLEGVEVAVVQGLLWWDEVRGRMHRLQDGAHPVLGLFFPTFLGSFTLRDRCFGVTLLDFLVHEEILRHYS